MSFSVENVQAKRYTGPLTRPFITSRRRTDAVDGVVVEVELSNGVLGHGSAAATMAVTGESVESIHAAATGPISQALKGSDSSVRALAGRIAGSCEGNTSAKAAVDMALHDAWARSLGLPLTEALGGSASEVLTTDMTISLEEPDDMAARAVEAVQAGYEVLKIKLGTNWKADLERLQSVRAAAPSVTFRLDANQGWDVKSAIHIIGRIEEAGLPVDLVEQPVVKHDLAGLATVTHAVQTPIMADESIASARDAIDIVSRDAADLLNIKLAKCGGIRQALQIADIAQAAGIECMIGAMMEPRVSITAALHIAAAHPNITLVDLDSAEWINDPSLTGGYTMDRGQLRLTGNPGIGFSELSINRMNPNERF